MGNRANGARRAKKHYDYHNQYGSGAKYNFSNFVPLLPPFFRRKIDISTTVNILPTPYYLPAMISIQRKYAIVRERVHNALVQRMVGNFGNYNILAREDGYNGKIFCETLKECREKAAKREWVSNETMCKIIQMSPECVCLICHIVGSSLMIPLCIMLTRFMCVPYADSRHAIILANIMDESTVRVTHDHCIVSSTGDSIMLPRGNYTATSLIAIMSGLLWGDDIDENAFSEFANAVPECDIVYNIRAHTRIRAKAIDMRACEETP